MNNSKNIEESVSKPEQALEFQAVDPMLPSSPHLSDDEKHHRMLNHIQKEFKVSHDDFLAMTSESHFNHQY